MTHAEIQALRFTLRQWGNTREAQFCRSMLDHLERAIVTIENCHAEMREKNARIVALERERDELIVTIEAWKRGES